MNEKMKKYIPVVIVLVVIAMVYLVGSFVVNQQRGKVRDVNRTLAESTVYSEKDITDATNTAQNHFYRNFKGFTLTDLWYPGDESLDEAEEWAAQSEVDEAIVLLSNFKVDSFGGMAV